ncbi:hypothetical protein MKW94_002069 [Papaver nudicaule]|uniref:Uncharacterized protein n=1 Tax=Papaver nudicaule TaxID=74823 RepID=A0AA41UYP7_PAPNU|nr:hypothetical protein [Papaver nudicaule]
MKNNKNVMSLFFVLVMIFMVFLGSVNACSSGVGEPCGIWKGRSCCGDNVNCNGFFSGTCVVVFRRV